MIIVTGASGQLGKATVERLLERVPAHRIGVSVRDPEKASELRARGVRVRQGDFEDPENLAHAFEGASRVLIVSVDDTGETALRRHRTAIEAAARAGADRILYTSHMGANPSSPFAPMPDHAATEAALKDLGVPFTSLRNGFYAASGVMLLGNALETGELAAPEDGPVSWTAHADLAEAAAIALTDDGGLDGLTPALTGAEAIDLTRVAEIASELTGRTIRRVVVSDEEYRAGLVAHGLPEALADLLLGIFVASRQGEFAEVDPTLARLLGRPPTSFRDVLTATVSPAR
ncbi:NAD(P)H-binding protein [Actinoallomurus sp. NPDC052308]|uniref:NAD(P)H-binding protein n=1 Tax=Actinoallomurus sp. NPDC052308 TaxID=3155530 RepID=UPI003428430A